MKKISLLILCLIITGCASVSVYHVPEKELKNLNHIYVVRFPKDTRHLEGIIADELKAMGYNATYGEKQNIPDAATTIVTYKDRWQWDMSNYMLDITIEFRDRQTEELIASGKSYRPSLQRRSQKLMIRETLYKILK
jgi:hypothetical protein